jgi:hypothetical protein
MRRGARPAGAFLLAVQLGTIGWAFTRAPDPIGVLPIHEALVARLAREPGRLYLMGHQGLISGVSDEHALVYLFAQHGRQLHATTHPASYHRVSWPAQDLAIPEADQRLLVITPDPDAVLNEGRELFRVGRFFVFAPEPGARPSNISFGAGFQPHELEPDREFRWADETATLWVDLPAEDACLVAEVRGTPDGDARALHVVARPFARDVWAPIADVMVGESEVPIGHDWALRTFARAAGTPQAVEVTFVYLGRRRRERVDTRPIAFALGNVDVRRGAACPSSDAPR